MSKTTTEPEVIEAAETQIPETVKPYAFRRLSSEDMFLMFRIIGKIGIKELKNCFSGETLDGVMTTFRKSGGDEKALAAVGVAVGFDAIDILLNNLPKCEKEIYQLLAQVSGMGIDEIKKDMILFTEMLIDFVKKDEFPDFIKVVSKLFK